MQPMPSVRDGPSARRSPAAAPASRSPPDLIQRGMAMSSRLERWWDGLQVWRRGKYSLERLESLDNYCKSASYTRVVLVCVLTPLPALATIAVLECLPLQDPLDGWAANGVFWVRISLTVFSMTLVSLAHLNDLMPRLGFTFVKRLIVALVTAGGYSGFFVAASSVVGFPVPLMWQFGVIPGSLFTPLALILVLGRRTFGRQSHFRPQLQRFYRFFLAHISLFGAYPLYKVMYDFVPVDYQTLALLILPIWKLAAKHFILHAMREIEDLLPEMVVLIVDLFNALFMSVCMQNARSLSVVILIIGSDFLQSIWSLHEVNVNANFVLALLEQHKAHHHQRKHKQRYQETRRASLSQASDLLTLLLTVSENPETFKIRALRSVRLWSCIPHPVPVDRAECLKALESLRIFDNGNPFTAQAPEPTRRRSPCARLRPFATAVAPAGPSVDSCTSLPKSSVSHGISRRALSGALRARRVTAADNARQMVVQGLQLLFHSEYLILVEYVECVIPFIYVVYKSLLEQLPNIAYYPGGPGNWGWAAVVNLMVYSALEIASFFLLSISFWRKFAFSPLYQLAFVLETQVHFVQCKLFLGIVCLLQYEVMHLGEAVVVVHRPLVLSEGYSLRSLNLCVWLQQCGRCRLHSPLCLVGKLGRAAIDPVSSDRMGDVSRWNCARTRREERGQHKDGATLMRSMKSSRKSRLPALGRSALLN